MAVLGSIFFEFNLPNATTWFYFSLLLGVALYFKFSRLMSMRNWDVLTLFLLVPGLLLLQEAHSTQAPSLADQPLTIARTITATGQAVAAPAVGLGTSAALTTAASPLTITRPGTLWLGYV